MSPHRPREQFLDALPEGLLARPLAFIQADHLRQRVLCHLMERIAEEEHLDGELARDVAAHLARDMRLHVIDEEEDLFPLLRRRAGAGDDIHATLGRLAADHRADQALAEAIVAALDAALATDEPARPDEALRDLLRRFAHGQRQHLALENAVLLPAAKARLTPEDLRGLSLRMAARRGVIFRLKEHEPA